MTKYPRRTRVALILAALVAVAAVWQAVAADIPSPVLTNSLGMPFAKVPGTKVLFCIWVTRVQDYGQWLKETGKTAEAPSFQQGPNHPAVNVNWTEAKAFCQWLTDKERKAGRITPEQSYRLPTDSEWSTAVGLNEPVEGTPEAKDGKVADAFPWGTEWPPPKDAGNYAGRLKVDTYRDTSPVGSFKPNAFGLYDMGGNVGQWCEDWYNARQKERTLRGGGFASDSRSSLLSARRGFMKPEYQMMAGGFRCVLVGKD
jgi:formylglycine-generating enzyme required for sulfatase activity